jgi:hypothetical protein
MYEEIIMYIFGTFKQTKIDEVKFYWFTTFDNFNKKMMRKYIGEEIFCIDNFCTEQWIP